MIGSRDREVCAPDLIEPVIGYRAWRLRDGELFSPYVEVAWSGGPLRAECLRDRVQFRPGGGPHAEPAPLPECACGIYAYFEPVDRVGGDPQFVRGAVALWGRIEVHREGMRAEFARVVVIAEPPDWRRRKELWRTAERLGVESVRPVDLRAASRRYGQPLPDSLLAV